MKVSEEKRYIYEMMREITTERRRLTDIYYDLKKRLDELNSLEIRGLEDLSLKGYVDLHSHRNREVCVENIKRESERAIRRVLDSSNEIEEKSVSIIPQDEIDRAKEIDSLGKVKMSKEKRKSTQLSLKEIVPAIEEALRESGIPLSIDDIRIEVEKILGKEINKGNFQRNILPRATKQSDRIKRATRGYYQYVGI